MDFSHIIGQKEITVSLENSLSRGKIGHAYIFSGPKGIGKKTVARIFAGLLLCSKGNSSQSCGQCLSCQLFESGSNPDFHEVNPDSGSIGVDEIREVIGDIGIRPMYSNRKVLLIADAGRMTAQAQNSLLKTLEEPPSYGVIILTASNYGALLETIRSRTIRLNFRKNSYREVRSLLEAKFGSDIQALDFIASYSDGVIGTALKLADSEEFIELREKIAAIPTGLNNSGLKAVFEYYPFFEANKDNAEVILDMLLLLYRDMLVCKNSGNENILINSDKKDIIFNNAAVFSENRLIKSIEAIEETRRNLKYNANYQLSMEVMLMKLQEEEV